MKRSLGLSATFFFIGFACTACAQDVAQHENSETTEKDQNPVEVIVSKAPGVTENPPSAVGPCLQTRQALNSALWDFKKVETFRVVNALGNPPSPNPVPANKAQLQICNGDVCTAPDIVLNGAFHARDPERKPVVVAGATMRQGVLDPGAPSFTLSNRGGVGLLSDGRIVFCKPSTPEAFVSAEAIQINCANGQAKVVDFMGGGAYLVRKGFKACSGSFIPDPCDKSIDLESAQEFRQPGPKGIGIHATQMGTTLHSIMAMKDGQAYVVFSKKPVSGQTIQDSLCAAGFSEVIQYDGGSGFTSWGPKAPVSSVGINPTAFLIKTN